MCAISRPIGCIGRRSELNVGKAMVGGVHTVLTRYGYPLKWRTE